MVDSRYSKEELAEFDRAGQEYEVGRKWMEARDREEAAQREQKAAFVANRAKLAKQQMSRVAQIAPASHRVAKVLPKAKPVIWRCADHPMPGTIYRLPDDRTLQRGITYTFLPDGRSIRVPAMNRLDVRASAESHREDEDGDIVEALQQILMGKRGKASFDGQGRARGRRAPERGPAAQRDVRGEGMRAMPLQAS